MFQAALPAILGLFLAATAAAAPAYRLIGQPSLADTTFAARCAGANARFGGAVDHSSDWGMSGPSGIAIDPRGRLYVTDYGGQRVLTWPNVEALNSCEAADGVIGVGELSGPEAVAIDVRSGTVFVADTLSHTVKGYRQAGKKWTRSVVLGSQDASGSGSNRFNFPRGLAVDADGRLFVADDYNNRVLIFDSPVTTGASAADSIGAGANGGFNGPKGLAMVGHTLFVSDYYKDRVLRFTGPFTSPSQVYVATGSFTGMTHPVDLAVHPDGSLLVTDQGHQRIARYKDAVWSSSATSPSSTFADHINPEPLGVAADRAGRIYIADYSAWRVLIREESVRTSPITAASSEATKALLADFHARSQRTTDRVAIGQQLITRLYGPKSDPSAWYGDWLKLEKRDFPLPEVMGGELSDLMSYPGFAPNQDALEELIRHGQAGHIVTLVWHPDNPTGGPFGTPISTENLQNMIKDATAVGKKWQTQLNRAADVLQKFEAAGVPVLFRPLHEQNGDFFWWGHNGATGAALRDRQAAWVAMWRDMVAELTVRKGLKALLFVYGANQVDYAQVAPPLTYYPGGDFADVVTIDVYNEQLNLAGGSRGLQHYAALVGTGKPFGLGEFGQSYDDNGTGANGSDWDARTLVKRVRDSYPRTTFATAWYSSVEDGHPYVFALADVASTLNLLQDPLSDTQDPRRREALARHRLAIPPKGNPKPSIFMLCPHRQVGPILDRTGGRDR